MDGRIPGHRTPAPAGIILIMFLLVGAPAAMAQEASRSFNCSGYIRSIA